MTVPDNGVATDLIVFGRGLEAASPSGELHLTEAARGRVDAALDYVAANTDAFHARAVADGRPGQVVFSGGWPGAAAGMPAPALEQREGNQMLDRFRAQWPEPVGQLGLGLYAEVRSDSTLENALCIWEDGCLAGREYSAERPLGLVAHAGHMLRVVYFIRKVLGLGPESVAHILAEGPDNFFRVPERRSYQVTRLCCLGARRPAALRRRHRWMVKTGRHLLRPVRTKPVL